MLPLIKTFFCRFYIFALSVIILVTVSCVDGVDLDTTDEIVLSPVVDVDLVYFSFNSDNFTTTGINGQELTVGDTTRLEFLDDSFVRDNLIEIEIEYLIASSFTQSLVNSSRFLDGAGNLQYEISFPIVASPDGSVVTTSYTAIVSESDLEFIRNSIQLVNEVSLRIDGNPINGEMSLRSKALFRFEIDEL